MLETTPVFDGVARNFSYTQACKVTPFL